MIFFIHHTGIKSHIIFLDINFGRSIWNRFIWKATGSSNVYRQSYILYLTRPCFFTLKTTSNQWMPSQNYFIKGKIHRRMESNFKRHHKMKWINFLHVWNFLDAPEVLLESEAISLNTSICRSDTRHFFLVSFNWCRTPDLEIALKGIHYF